MSARCLQPKVLIVFFAFLSSNYSMFIINPEMLVLDTIKHLSTFEKSAFSTAALLGIVIGELLFGRLADAGLGVSQALAAALSLVVLGSLMGTIGLQMGLLVASRFMVGLGIGGCYPLSATISTQVSATAGPEDPEQQWRQKQLTTLFVFSSQGFALIMSNCVAVFLLWPRLAVPLDVAWRACVLVGGALAFCALMAFLWLPGAEDRRGGKRPAEHLGGLFKIHAHGLVGTCGGWFLFDIMFYANGLFSAIVMEDVLGRQTDPFGIMQQSLSLSILPMAGFAAAGLYISESRFSLKSLQLAGFLAMTAIYLIMSLEYDRIRTLPPLFIGLYAMTFLFANAGPNSTTFILPTVVFKSHTATCHGVSAAAGKLGAMVGSAGMAPLLARYGTRVVFLVCAIVGLLGALVTYLCIPAEGLPAAEKDACGTELEAKRAEDAEHRSSMGL